MWQVMIDSLHQKSPLLVPEIKPRLKPRMEDYVAKNDQIVETLKEAGGEMTSVDLALEFGMHRTSMYARLERLMEQGRVTKRVVVGTASVAYWRAK